MLQGIDYLTQDPWLAIENLVKSILHETLHTVSLVEVVEVTNNKVSVNDLVIQKESTVPPVVYHNVPVVMPQNDKLQITYPVAKGDRGILLTCKLDISELKKSNQPCKTNMSRYFDKNDSVFIPLFFNKKNLEPADDNAIELKYHDNVVKIKKADIVIETEGAEIFISKDKILIKNESKVNLEVNDGDIELIGKKINLNCDTLDCTPIKTMLDGLKARCDALSKGMAGSGTNNVAYTTLVNTTEKANDPFGSIDG